jgi:hypothetical protein
MATILATLIIIDTIQVFGRTERGLLDPIPDIIRQILIILYPLLVLASLAIAILTRKTKTKFDIFVNALLFVNGLTIAWMIYFFIR